MANHAKTLKLDKVLARNCGVDRAKSALIEMVGQFAGRLDAWLVVEGVETLPDLEEIIRLGAPLAQGHYFGRPGWKMEPLSPQQSFEIQDAQRGLQKRDGLGPAIEKCTTCENTGDAEELLHDDDQVTIAVIDRWNRPVALVERLRPEGVRVLTNFTRVIRTARRQRCSIGR